MFCCLMQYPGICFRPASLPPYYWSFTSITHHICQRNFSSETVLFSSGIQIQSKADFKQFIILLLAWYVWNYWNCIVNSGVNNCQRTDCQMIWGNREKQSWRLLEKRISAVAAVRTMSREEKCFMLSNTIQKMISWRKQTWSTRRKTLFLWYRETSVQKFLVINRDST